MVYNAFCVLVLLFLFPDDSGWQLTDQQAQAGSEHDSQSRREGGCSAVRAECLSLSISSDTAPGNHTKINLLRLVLAAPFLIITSWLKPGFNKEPLRRPK